MPESREKAKLVPQTPTERGGDTPIQLTPFFFFFFFNSVGGFVCFVLPFHSGLLSARAMALYAAQISRGRLGSVVSYFRPLTVYGERLTAKRVDDVDVKSLIFITVVPVLYLYTPGARLSLMILFKNLALDTDFIISIYPYLYLYNIIYIFHLIYIIINLSILPFS